MNLALLELKNLHVALEDGTEIVKGVDLSVDTNETHALMGPNGSGKSTLAYALMGHPAYVITDGQILFDGEDVTERARAHDELYLAAYRTHLTFYERQYAARLATELAALLRLRAQAVDRALAPLDRLGLVEQVEHAVAVPELIARVGEVVLRVRLVENAFDAPPSTTNS